MKQVSESRTKLQRKKIILFHVQTNTEIRLKPDLDIVYIGRKNSLTAPNIDVSNYPNSNIVSRLHTKIIIENNTYFIEDLCSSNGTYLNNKRLVIGNRYQLHCEDVISLGQGNLITFIFKIVETKNSNPSSRILETSKVDTYKITKSIFSNWVICPNCNHQNPEGSLQCENCYTPLPGITYCPNCRASVEIDATFCGQCGFNLQAENPSIATPIKESAIDSSLDVFPCEISLPEEPSFSEQEADILPEMPMSSPMVSPWDEEEEIEPLPNSDLDSLPNLEEPTIENTETPTIDNAVLLRYPYLHCDSSYPINKQFILKVQVLIKPPEPNSEAMEIQDKSTTEMLPKVEIVVRARNFDIEGRNTDVIKIYRDKDTEKEFDLIPRKLGEQQIRVDFYQNGSRIGTTRRSIQINSENNPTKIEIPQPEEQPALEFKKNFSAPPPDLELCVELDRNDKNTFYFTLHSTKSEIDYHHKKVGQITLKGSSEESSPEEKIKSVYTELGQLAERISRTGTPVNLDPSEIQTSNKQQRDEDRLILVGEELWEELIPEQLKREYWKFKDKVQSLLITSDEPWIPWEMIKPYDRDEDLEEPFWCDQFAMSRWLSGPGTAEEFPSESVLTVAPDSSDLPNVIKEVDFLQRLSDLRCSILSIPPISNGLDLKEYLKKKEFSILHFACHGMFDRNRPNDSAISLTGDSFCPGDIRIKFKETRPLIFINACHGGRIGFSFTKIGGWAEKFVNARVGVFIGAMWEVNDELAYLFAETFYTGLLKDNLTVAKAFQKSRQVIRDAAPYNSTWLAYSLYANPEARIRDSSR